MSDYHAFRIGPFQAPLSTSLSNTLLKDVDSPIYYALSFYTWLLESHLGARWREELSSLGFWNAEDGYTLGDTSDGYLVAQSISLDPTVYFQERQWKFPLLAVYRTKGIIEPKTAVWYRERFTWVLDFILPPLSPLEAEALTPILKAVLGVITNFTEKGYDPDYNSAQEVWSLARIESIRVVDAEISTFRLQDGSETGASQNFPCLTLTLEVCEREELPDGAYTLDTLTGVDGYVSLDPADGQDEVSNVADFQNNDLDT